MKFKIINMLLLLLVPAVFANTEPTVQVKSAAMRPGTTLMDIVYRITDPDDATVKVRALAFIDGVRSFANVIKPVTWAEGTETNIGDTVATGVDHTLTWNVGVDWNIDLGQVKFEVLCRDSRGLLAFDWVTIPAAGGYDEMTISKNAPTDTEVLDAFFWQYAAGDAALSLSNGVLRGNANAGVFDAYPLVKGAELETYAPAYLFKQMNLQPASIDDINFAQNIANAGLSDTGRWHALNKSYTGIDIIFMWGNNFSGELNIPKGLIDVKAITTGRFHSMALTDNGTVVSWSKSLGGGYSSPTGLTNIIAISDGLDYSLALRSNGTVVAWGSNIDGQCDVPTNLSGVVAISAGAQHSMAIKNNGTVVAWGNSFLATVPNGLSNVVDIAGGYERSMALKDNGTVVAWGDTYGFPTNLTGVRAVDSGGFHSLALKNNGVVVAWGYNFNGELDIPAEVSGIIEISAGVSHSMALKNDGTVVAWGNNDDGQCDVPVGLSNVTAIAAGEYHSLALKVKQP